MLLNVMILVIIIWLRVGYGMISIDLPQITDDAIGTKSVLNDIYDNGYGLLQVCYMMQILLSILSKYSFLRE